MKNLVTLFLLIGLCSMAHAQGNLQFNQAIFVEWGMNITPNVVNQTIDQVIVVPAGKVWKIESAMATYVQNNTPFANHSSQVQILLNRKIIHNSLSTNLAGNIFPIWLPAGTYTLRLVHTSNTSSTNHEAVAAISAIEFNLVP